MHTESPFLLFLSYERKAFRQFFETEKSLLDEICWNEKFHTDAFTQANFTVVISEKDCKDVILWLHENAQDKFAMCETFEDDYETFQTYGKRGETPFYWMIFLMNKEDCFAVKMLASYSVDFITPD